MSEAGGPRLTPAERELAAQFAEHARALIALLRIPEGDPERLFHQVHDGLARLYADALQLPPVFGSDETPDPPDIDADRARVFQAVWRRSELMLAVTSHENEGVLRLTHEEHREVAAAGFATRPEGKWVGY
jgi:hypothetical protein